MPPSAAVLPAPDPWLSLVRRSGAEGRAWADAYRRWEPVAALNPVCLRLLHARRWEEGAEALARFRAAVDRAVDADPATRAVLERWYQAVYGYALYCRDDHAGAERAMVRAGDEVARAVGELGALLPLVHHCHEFRLHRARIARNQRRWDEMWAHVDEVRAMFEGRAPYCLLPDGRAVGLAEVKAYHRALGGLDAAERAAVDALLDDRARMDSFDRFVHVLCRIPGFVIPYP
jgi:hypothetical protein